ncbi:MAG: glutamate-1-semialdehyde 2,1-aminomutase [Phycisphaerae bacterium]
MAKTSKPKSRYARSEKLFEQARTLMPGGVSSPVRSFKSVGLSPVFIKEAKGARLIDIDGNSYLDYVMSYGPLIAGHCPPTVRAAVAKQIDKGSSYGCCSELEVRLAEKVIKALPAVEMVRFVNSGTEATMSALRLARGATGRDVIVKCAGCYHGHVDALLVQAGSGATTHGNPSSPGVPASITANTAIVPYNDLAAAQAVFEQLPGAIAAFVVEPVCGNMGVVLPEPGYLQGLRDLCTKHGALLIFDEVMSGFRVAWGGAQNLYGIRPDITCLGKIIGGGLPVGAYGGRRDLMERISPAGPIYQAGTLSGNPLAMAAGLATLELLEDGAVYELLEHLAARLQEGLVAAAAEANVSVQRFGPMITPFFLGGNSPKTIRNYAEALTCDTAAYARFFKVMLDGGVAEAGVARPVDSSGVMLPPAQFEAWFVSSAHTEGDIDATIDLARAAFKAAKQ